MKRKIFVCFCSLLCSSLLFSMGKKDKIIINSTVDNIEHLCKKEKLSLFYSDDNSNALQIAIKGENLAVAEWLAENEICDLNHSNIYGRTPINDAIDASDIELLKILIEHGAKIKRNNYIKDPVIQTVVIGNVEAAEYFKTLGFKYNFVMADGKNMLHLAAKFSQKDIVPFLIKNGCKIDAADSEKQTPLLISIVNDDSDTAITLLENGASLEKRDDTGQTPIFFAVEKFSNSTLEALIGKKANIEAKDAKNRTPFLFAYELDNIDAATSLIKAGASFPKQQLITALKEQKTSYLPLLLEAGADISVTDSAGQNVLHIASSKSDGSSLTLFLESKNAIRIINSKDSKGNTPLLLACGTGTGFTNGVKILLDSGASVSESDSNGNLAIHVAVLNNRDSASKELSQLILEKKPSALNAANYSGQTPLLIALKNAKTETSTWFLTQKVDVSPKDSTGNTALHYACANSMDDLAKKIISLGGAINAVNNRNETPLGLSAKNKNESLSDYFLELKGINIDIKDSSGKSPRSYLWDLYDLRIAESRKRREEYTEARQKAWDDAASAKQSKYKVEKEIRDLESENRTLESKINYAKEGTDTSSWKRQITANNISITIKNISLAAFNIAINLAEKEAAEYSSKIDDEFAISQSYIDKEKKLNTIPRQ
ncbi:ankyrin repeat domain-containing protein [uncultured Treponema sp.]|uniref:ankyrin repeat domain-containing protein n=1 Tax=uncultured Treponema sp. TaxID=162155 RepID=UPI0025DB6FEC|nr:ankyrin repeat domain-containing protein [uncultured Treponema sp.]